MLQENDFKCYKCDKLVTKWTEKHGPSIMKCDCGGTMVRLSSKAALLIRSTHDNNRKTA